LISNLIDSSLKRSIVKYLKKELWLLIIVFCLFLLTVPGCDDGSESRYPQTVEKITALIEQEMEKNEVTGLSIALVDGQDVVWARGFGYADKENGIRATAGTIYEIGSVSKTITATAVMHAQDKGLLDIDHPLTEYVTEFSILPPLGYNPQPDNPITVRTMLTHHSGIPGNLLNGAFTIEPRTDYTAWLLDYFHSDYACFRPNFVHAYSNSAYSLLADVVAAASGKSFEEYTDQLFEAMGMHYSSYFLHKPFLKENRARGYLNGEPLEHFYNAKWGAGSVYSNVLDMATYIKMILSNGQGGGGQVLRPETLNEMLTPQDLGIPLDAVTWYRAGLGWGLSDPELEYAGRVCGHDGATIGFSSHLEILLDHELGVVVSSNSDQKNAMGVIVEVGRETLKLALKEKAGIEPVEPSGPTYSPYTTRPQKELEALAGVYVTEGGYDIINAVQGALEWLTSEEGETQRLLPLENGRFALPDSQEFQMEFTRISGRDVMVLHSAYTHLRGNRYEPVPTPAIWQTRIGQYDITNLYPDDSSRFVPDEISTVSHTINLEERDGMLVLGFTVQATPILLVIEPFSDTVALIRGLGDDKGGAVQVVMVDGQEEIQLWGSLYKKK
jgi:CubicO group peptidase (beta-lactamase class C family)